MTMTTHSPASGHRPAGRIRAAHRRPARHRVPHHRVAQQRSNGQATWWQRCAAATWTVLAVAGTLVGTCAVVLAVATRLSPAGQFTAFGHPVLVVLSGSMSPVISTGDLIVDDPVTPATARHLRVGQVISFRALPGSSVIITHRIIGVATSRGAVRYYPKGDANPSADAAARPAKDVVGVFSYSIGGGGFVLTALHRPLVLGLLIGSPLLWLLAGSLFQFADRMGGESSVNRGDSDNENVVA